MAPARAFVIRAATRDEMLGFTRTAISQIDAGRLSSPAELIASLVSSQRSESILAIVAHTLADFRAKLERTISLLADGRRSRIHDANGIYFNSVQLARSGKIATVFPGEGSQYDGALAGMDEAFPELGALLDPQKKSGEGMWEMSSAVARVLTADCALGWLLTGLRLRADGMIGHSTGAMAALIAANRIDARKAASLVAFFEDLERMPDGVTADPPPMALIAAGANEHEVTRAAAAIDSAPLLAMINCPHQTVIVVAPEKVPAMLSLFADKGILAEQLPFDRPYHTKLFAGFVPPLEAFYGKWLTQAGDVPVYCCSTAAPMPGDIEAARKIAVKQWIEPVRFAETIERMYADGFRVFVEAGPRGNLSAFIGDILRGRPHAAIPADLPHRNGPVQIVHAIAQIAAHGFDVETDLAKRDTMGKREMPDRIPAAAMALHLEFMERFYETERSVMESYLARKAIPVQESVGPAAERERDSSVPDLPLLGTILSRTSNELVAIRDFNTDEDLFLRDHSFGGKVSRLDSSLSGLPVMPLTMTLELMAEAASVLEPGRVLIAFSDIVARRWATSDTNRFSLRVEARRSGRGDGISVVVQEHDQSSQASGVKRPPLAEATLKFADQLPASPAVRRFSGRAQHTRIGSDVIYDRYMFHGPAFRGTISVDEVATDGARASLAVLPRDAMFASRRDPQFITDAVLLDQPGQVLGVWMNAVSSGNPVAFPVHVESIELYGHPLPPGEHLTCAISGASTEDGLLVGNLDIVRDDGSVWGRITGWKDRRFDLPDRFRVNSLVQVDYHLSAPLSDALLAVPGVTIYSLGDDVLPASVMESGAGVWTRTLAAIVLSRKEREHWRRIPANSARQVEWLIGRTVAKDALRSFVLREFGLGLLSADVEIESRANGSPIATGSWTKLIQGPVPHVSISHTHGLTIAAVASGDTAHGLGVDVERIDRVNDDVANYAFSESDVQLIEGLPEATRQQWRARLWCAREAVAKASGDGLKGNPESIGVRSIDIASGIVEVKIDSGSTHSESRTISVETAVLGDFAIAACLLLREPIPQTIS